MQSSLERSPTNRQLAGYAVGYIVGSVAQKSVGFALFLLLAQLLTVEQYALFGLIYALQAGIASFAMAGTVEMTIAQLRHRNSPDDRRALFRLINFRFVIITIAVALVASIGSILISTMPLVAILLAVFIGALGAFLTVQAQFARLLEMHSRALLLGNLPQLSGLIFAAAAAGFSVKSTEIMSALLLGYIFCFLILALFGRVIEHRVAVTGDNLKDIRKYTPFVAVSFFDWVAGYGSFFLFRSLFSDLHVAQFTLAYALSSALHLVGTSLNQVWSPKIYRHLSSQYSKSEAYKFKKENTIFYILQGISIGVSGILIMTFCYIAPLFMGDDGLVYLRIATGLFYLIASYSILIPWYYSQNFFYFHGDGNLLWKISVFSGSLGLIVWYAMASSFGVVGGYAGFFTMVALKSASGVYLARRKWGVEIQWVAMLASLFLVCSGALVIENLTQAGDMNRSEFAQ